MKNQQNKISAEEELALLKKELKLLRRENELHKKESEKLKKQVILRDAKLEVIKKSNPTFQTIDMVEMMKTKEFKHYAYQKIAWLTCEGVADVREACKYFGVGSPDKFYVFSKKHNLPTKSTYGTTKEFIFVPYVARGALKATEVIDEFYELHPNTAASAESIKIWSDSKYPWFKISLKRIRKIQDSNPATRPHVNRNPKSKDTINKVANVRPDQVGLDYATTKLREKIGMDGTWMKIRIRGSYIKLLLEIAYDWFSREIISYTWSHSENTEAVCRTFDGILKYVGNNVEHCIVQMDRGSANRSYALLEAEKSQSIVSISMSESGFKHNSPTESLNGWIKDRFFEANGWNFESIEKFQNVFKKFVKSNNMVQKLKYNNDKIIMNKGASLN